VRALTFAVACCLVLAGCNAGPSPATAGDEGEQTLTPAPVPDEERTTPAPAHPPGVNSISIQSVDALATAHRDALENDSYIWVEREREQRESNGTLRTRVLRTERMTVENGTYYRRDLVRQQNWDSIRWHHWYNRSTFANGTALFWRISGSGTPRYERGEVVDDRDQFRYAASFALRQFLTAGNASVEVVVRDGQPFHRIVVDRPEGTRYPQSDDYTAIALVEPSGFVRQFRVNYELQRPDGRTVTTYEFRYERVGNVSVDRPEWLQAARTNTSIDDGDEWGPRNDSRQSDDPDDSR
jgi:hypothetical protein